MLTKLLTYYKEGTTVNLTVQRLENGEYVEKEIPITLNARPQEEETAEQTGEITNLGACREHLYLPYALLMLVPPALWLRDWLQWRSCE